MLDKFQRASTEEVDGAVQELQMHCELLKMMKRDMDSIYSTLRQGASCNLNRVTGIAVRVKTTYSSRGNIGSVAKTAGWYSPTFAYVSIRISILQMLLTCVMLDSGQ